MPLSIKYWERDAMLWIGNLFEIDTQGRIWRIGRITNAQDSDRVIPIPRQRAEQISKFGYLRVKIKLGHNLFVKALAHRMVWQYFIGDIPLGLTINHIDGNRFNNNPGNLEVMTLGDNIRKGGTGKGNFRYGEDRPNTKLTDAIVKAIRCRYQPRDKINGMAAMAREFGVGPTAIWQVVTCRRWKHVK